MIAHLRGLLLAKSPNQAIVECAGVGYDVAISVATFTAMPPEGQEARLHIYTRVAEDALALFGFFDRREKRLFEKLLTISGIGPKLAITVLSGIDSARLVTAIRAGDHAALVKIPGIGKKTAERVVLELRDKLDELDGLDPGAIPASASPALAGPTAEDALSALINLGYPRPIAQKAIESALTRDPATATHFEKLFRAALSAIK